MRTATLRISATHRSVNTRTPWRQALDRWRCWRRRVRARDELRAMDARALADIGMDPETARQESCKFFWQR